MKSNFRKKLLISLSILLGLVLVLCGALYYLSGNLSIQADKIVVDQALIKQQVAALSVLASLKHDAPVAAQYQAAMNGLLPTSDNLISFPGRLNALASSHHVSLSFAFQGANTPPSAGSPASTGFSIGVSGGPSDVLAFMSDLESHLTNFLVSVDSFSFSTNGSNSEIDAQGRVFSR